MFVLVEMKDTVRIKPHLFGLDRTETISTQLNKKFANKVATFERYWCRESLLQCVCVCLPEKVIHQVGLCIALHDITKIEDSYILPGDGAYHCKGISYRSLFRSACISVGLSVCQYIYFQY